MCYVCAIYARHAPASDRIPHVVCSNSRSAVAAVAVAAVAGNAYAATSYVIQATWFVCHVSMSYIPHHLIIHYPRIHAIYTYTAAYLIKHGHMIYMAYGIYSHTQHSALRLRVVSVAICTAHLLYLCALRYMVSDLYLYAIYGYRYIPHVLH
jgi:hypothetical protein